MMASGPLTARTETEIVPKIERVILYPDSALILRNGKVSLQKGDNTIRIPALPSQMMENSLQVRLGKELRITGVNVRQTHLLRRSDEAIVRLRARLEETEGLIRARTGEAAAISNAADFLKRLSPFPQNHRPSAGEIESHTRFLEKSLSEHYAKSAALEARLKELRDEKARLEKELSRLETPQPVKIIEVNVWSPDTLKNQPLELSYLTPNARWTPLYTLRADTASGEIEWNGYVSITQSSGEEWRETPIEISTARPLGSQAPAPLEGWYLDVYRPAPPVRAKALAFEAAAPYADGGFAPPAPSLREETTSFSVRLPSAQTVPSDGEPHRFFIASAISRGDFRYRAVPGVSPHAYMSAETANPFPFALLPGEMTLILDGRVVGSHTAPETLYPQEAEELSFGIDEGIRIERKQTKKYTKEKGILSPETEVEYGYTHEITNTKNQTVRLRVEDHFPRSRNEQIRVRLDEPKKGEAEISENGVVTWNLELPPHAKRTLPLRFGVTYPAGIRVEGLD